MSLITLRQSQSRPHPASCHCLCCELLLRPKHLLLMLSQSRLETRHCIPIGCSFKFRVETLADRAVQLPCSGPAPEGFSSAPLTALRSIPTVRSRVNPIYTQTCLVSHCNIEPNPLRRVLRGCALTCFCCHRCLAALPNRGGRACSLPPPSLK